MKDLKTRLMTWRLGRAVRILAIIFAPQPRGMLAVVHDLACSMVMAGVLDGVMSRPCAGALAATGLSSGLVLGLWMPLSAVLRPVVRIG